MPATPKVKLTGGDINSVIDLSNTLAKIFPPKHGDLPGIEAREKIQSLTPSEFHALMRGFASLHRVARKLSQVEFKTA